MPARNLRLAPSRRPNNLARRDCDPSAKTKTVSVNSSRERVRRPSAPRSPREIKPTAAVEHCRDESQPIFNTDVPSVSKSWPAPWASERKTSRQNYQHQDRHQISTPASPRPKDRSAVCRSLWSAQHAEQNDRAGHGNRQSETESRGDASSKKRFQRRPPPDW